MNPIAHLKYTISNRTPFKTPSPLHHAFIAATKQIFNCWPAWCCNFLLFCRRSAWRKAPPVRNIQGRKRNDLAPKLNSQPREEGWLGETRNRPRAWPCSPGAGEGSRPRGPLVCTNGSCSAHPGRINQVGPGENRIAGTPIQWQWTGII